MNQEQLFQELKKEHGDNVVLFAPTQHSFESAFSLFQKAMIVIGAHGGAMYNAMFSSPKAKIVEIMPIGSDGLYPGQNSSAAVPSFAHMAIYTNAQLMGQPFYRYYQITNGTTNMNVSISDVVDFINEVIEDDV